MIDLSKYTEQEIFDKAVAGLASQGFERSAISAPDGGCRYRFGEKRCAAGWLIPDGEYQTKWDQVGGMTWTCLVRDGFATSAHERFVSNLQTIHDTSYTPEDMRESLKQVALSRGLKIPPSLED